MSDEDRKADLLERSSESLRKSRLVSLVTVKKLPEIESRDLVIFVELVGFALSQAIGMRLAHLVEPAELLVERVDVCHRIELLLGREQRQKREARQPMLAHV